MYDPTENKLYCFFANEVEFAKIPENECMVLLLGEDPNATGESLELSNTLPPEEESLCITITRGITIFEGIEMCTLYENCLELSLTDVAAQEVDGVRIIHVYFYPAKKNVVKDALPQLGVAFVEVGHLRFLERGSYVPSEFPDDFLTPREDARIHLRPPKNIR